MSTLVDRRLQRQPLEAAAAKMAPFRSILLALGALAGLMLGYAPAAGAGAYRLTIEPPSSTQLAGRAALLFLQVTGPDPDSVSLEVVAEGADSFGVVAINHMAPGMGEGLIEVRRATPGTVLVRVTTNVGASASAEVVFVGAADSSHTHIAPLPPATGTGLAEPNGRSTAAWSAAVLLVVVLPLLAWQWREQQA